MTVPDDLLGEREITSPGDMEALGRTLGEALAPGDVVVLTGALGAGKTTLTRGIGAGLGIRGPVQSPTFVLARSHPSLVGGAPLVHVDAYRLGSPAELDDLDIDVAGSVVIVEWGRGMVEYLADAWWEIEIERQLGGRGVDDACAGWAPHTEELDADAPRTVRITRHP
jgi:tRNA threonylcarbamoyl adenosine modification protein YjeE